MKHEGWSVAAGGIPDGTFTVARPSQRDNCHLPARHFRSHPVKFPGVTKIHKWGNPHCAVQRGGAF